MNYLFNVERGIQTKEAGANTPASLVYLIAFLTRYFNFFFFYFIRAAIFKCFTWR